MIKNKITELSTLREMCYGLSAISNEERVQTTPNHDKIGTVVAKLDSLERKIDALVDEYADKREKIINQIDSMDDEALYGILFARYIQQKTFERIAADMDYSFRQICRLHTKALQEFEKKYGHEYLKKMA
jgi:DNA-directed RNA polymerase specialized sigma subunit